ncbi:hypothetical protein Tco_0431090, partial [Tanacetum coccineum]
MSPWSLVLFNPFTDDLRELPESEHDLESLCFSAPPTSLDCMVVGFTTERVYFHFVNQKSTWRGVRLGTDPHTVCFPAFYGGALFLFCEQEVMVINNLGKKDCSGEVFESEDLKGYCKSPTQYFITNCDEHRLLVGVGEYGEAVEFQIPCLIVLACFHFILGRSTTRPSQWRVEKRVLTESERSSRRLEVESNGRRKKENTTICFVKRLELSRMSKVTKLLSSFILKLGGRNNKCNIRGLIVNGVWCEVPNLIKAEMASHYKLLFSERGSPRPIFCSNKIVKIDVDEARALERGFCEKE